MRKDETGKKKIKMIRIVDHITGKRKEWVIKIRE